MGLQLTALGLHLPTLLGHSGATVAECAACGTRATKLFHVTTATPKGKCIVDAINERLGEQKARRVDPTRKESVKTKLKKKNDENGEYVCGDGGEDAEEQRIQGAEEVRVSTRFSTQRERRR